MQTIDLLVVTRGDQAATRRSGVSANHDPVVEDHAHNGCARGKRWRWLVAHAHELLVSKRETRRRSRRLILRSCCCLMHLPQCVLIVEAVKIAWKTTIHGIGYIEIIKMYNFA